MLKRIYFDANAGTPLLPEARAAVVAALEEPGDDGSAGFQQKRSPGIGVEIDALQH